MNHRLSTTVAALFALSIVAAVSAQDAAPAIQINVDKVKAQVSPNLYGLMTEEINYSYDGGLYGELIRNRVFKGSETPRGGRRGGPATAPGVNVLAHWSVAKYNGSDATISLETAQPLNDALGNSLKLDASALTTGQKVGIANDGYWGIPVRPNTSYRASFYARAAAPGGILNIAIESADGASTVTQADVSGINTEWKQYTVTLKTGDVKESAANRFVITTATPGVYYFNLVSLFPPTYNDRPNGNRIDLMQKLVDLRPAFLRFPGGNYVEGNDKDNYFNWKITVGPIAQRPTHLSPWNYRSTDGMGLLEFLEWTEDMHAQPVLAVFAGFTLRGTFVATDDALQPFVQDALDEIEYVTGDASTKWGAQRIADGHPAPFTLNYVEVGNEDNLGGGAATYENRFAHFFDAIRAKYPAIKIISTAVVHDRKADLIDEHFYMPPVQSEMTAHRYDTRSRDGTQVFVGEWATRLGQTPTTNLQCALADAAWLTGLERNSDLVQISCYAPLFVNVNPGGMQWASDLIGYDVINSFGSPSYYVQKMFNNNIGDVVLDSSASGVPIVPTPAPAGGRRGASQPAAPRMVNIEQLYYVVTKDTKTGTVYLKVVNISGKPMSVKLNLAGANVAPDADCWVLSSASDSDTNSITDPERVVPKAAPIHDAATSFTHEFPAYSVSIVLLKTN
jgi:alpha-N-arabinofuranosidase